MFITKAWVQMMIGLTIFKKVTWRGRKSNNEHKETKFNNWKV